MTHPDQCPNPDCGAKINWSEDRCLVCNQDLGAPNQRLANREKEVNALMDRYQTVKEAAKLRGAQRVVEEFEQNIQRHSQAVVNASVKFLHGFITTDNQLYANYRQQTSAPMRKVAELNNDRQRCGTEGILFGSIAEHIEYAALALNDKGLISYGNCTMVLKEITMHNKATVLEENSYDFVIRHKILPGTEPPLGYQANWQYRHRLAVAKLASDFMDDTENFADILLSSNGDRGEDSFIEVHIYGSFDKQAIAKIALPGKKLKNKIENIFLSGIEDYATHQHIPCSRYD